MNPPPPQAAPITQWIGPYASWHLNTYDTSIPDGFGYAKVEASGPIAVVNNDFNTSIESRGATQTYSAITQSSNTLYCPGLYDLFWIDLDGYYISSLCIQNVGSLGHNVTVDYSGGNDETVYLGPGERHWFLYNRGDYPVFFSAEITAPPRSLLDRYRQCGVCSK